MMDIGFLVFRAYFATMMTVGMMASLTDFRVGRKKLFFVLAGYSLWAIGSSTALLWIGGELLLMRLFYITISVPATVLSYWMANDTPVQAVFNYMTQILLSLLVLSFIRVLTEIFGLSGFMNIFLMGLCYAAIIFLEWRFLRRPFRRLIQMIPARWGILTMIPCVFCIYFIFVASWPSSYLENYSQIVYVYVVVIPLVIVYVVVFKSLYDLYSIEMERHSMELLAVQITALKEKLQKMKELDDEIRIQRHDMRHRLQVAKELVVRGDNKAALDFLDAAKKRLDDQKEISWCNLPILDAVFSSYFDKAKRQNIRVIPKISQLETIPVDEGELAIVVANALENAIHANEQLPAEQREIRCKMVGSPSIMLEIANPYSGKVRFDAQGLPVASTEGHGLGVQSIVAFCRKNGAVSQFELVDDWFRLRLVL